MAPCLKNDRKIIIKSFVNVSFVPLAAYFVQLVFIFEFVAIIVIVWMLLYPLVSKLAATTANTQ
jgi:hypothetical protein